MGCNNESLFTLSYFQVSIGVALIGLTSFILHWLFFYREVIEPDLYAYPVWFLIIAIVLTILGMQGIIVSYMPRPTCLFVHASLMLMLFICEIMTWIVALSFKEETLEVIRENMTKFYEKYEDSSSIREKMLVDVIHQYMECCGIYSYTDWMFILEDRSNASYTVPKSCCFNPSVIDCNVISQDPGDPLPQAIYRDGCYGKLIRWFKEKETVVLISFVTVLALQAGCVLTAFLAAKKIAKYLPSRRVSIII